MKKVWLLIKPDQRSPNCNKKQLQPAQSFAEAETLLEQTSEAEAIYTRTGRTPIGGFPDVRELASKIHAALFFKHA